MIINIDDAISQARNVEDLKPLLRILAAALNTSDDAKKEIRGDLVFYDSGPVIRATDGKYYRMTVGMTAGSPVATFTLVGPNPTGV